MDGSFGHGNTQLGWLLRSHLQLHPQFKACMCTSGVRSCFEQCWVMGKQSWFKTSAVHVPLSFLAILCKALDFHLKVNYHQHKLALLHP